ncbi:2TM domain-containing protein [Flavobacteriaceae bacterium MAR_2010_188]|nr:2TM domain-containing protein [Flavobacteriaceae bacterium MAR_2010_188]
MEKYKIKPYGEKEPLNDYAKEELYLRAKKRIEKLKGFYWHLAVYLVINIFLICINGLKSNGDFWEFHTFSTAIWWGIGIAFHGAGVFGPSMFFGKDWEDRKMKEYMEKEKQGRE